MGPRRVGVLSWALFASLWGATGAARAEDASLELTFGAVRQPIFEHLRADLSDPHFGMRLYWDHPVPGTLHDIPDPAGPDANARAAAPNGNHAFWDVSFGERGPVAGWYDTEHCSRGHSCGVALSLIAAVYLLMDLGAQSAAVLDTDYRIGAAIDARPWWPLFDRLSLSVGYYHQSSHLGDEYVLSAPTIQSTSSPPEVNPFLPYRANPAIEAFPIVLSVDLPELGAVRWRAYGGATFIADTVLPLGTQYRAGGEIRWDQPFADLPVSPDGVRASAQRVWRDLDFLLAYEALFQNQYGHLGPVPGPPVFERLGGYWVTQHAVLAALYNLDLDRSSTNAVALGIEVLWGRVQHGQLMGYATVGTGSVSLSYYW